jgi:hypothetical protein
MKTQILLGLCLAACLASCHARRNAEYDGEQYRPLCSLNHVWRATPLQSSIKVRDRHFASKIYP